MTQIPATEPTVPADDEAAAFAVMSTDAVQTGRAMSCAEYLAGLMLAAQLDVVGTPKKLPAAMWADQDPAVVQEIFNYACAVVWRAAQFAGSPWLYRDRLQSLQGQLTEAGFHAMGGSVARSRGLVVRPGHPADGEIARERED